ncbi:hypothetical protein [Methylomonas koyamae]|uniref:hypothetical protein n=1 Tax=Methylomonas koyamae TaxID=702114 RepID=UPI0018D332D8|nr:hypothetical protein [Methylomonas koyamae]
MAQKQGIDSDGKIVHVDRRPDSLAANGDRSMQDMYQRQKSAGCGLAARQRRKTVANALAALAIGLFFG